MAPRQTSGSVVCPSCGRLVGVQEKACPHCGRPAPGFWGYGRWLQRLGQDFGVVPFVIAVCAVLYVVSLLKDPSRVALGGMLGFGQPSTVSLIELGASGAVPVFGLGRWWTLFSASWLHGSLLHILFNMLWVRQLLPATVRLYGLGRGTLIYLVAGVAGFALTSVAGLFLQMPVLGGARVTIGASASIFGLLGALVAFGRRTGSSALGQQAWTWAVVMFLFGFLMPGIDNYAHLGGFGGGYAAARVLDPMREERLDHVLAAAVGLLVSLGAIVASVLAPLPL